MASLRKENDRGRIGWPKLFQNLRASRETELMAQFPAKDVAAWLGNSVPVAMKHYAMATDASFQTAADPTGRTIIEKPKQTDAESGGSIGGSISGVSGAIEPGTENEETPFPLSKNGVSIVQDSRGNYFLMGDTEFESVTSTMSTSPHPVKTA